MPWFVVDDSAWSHPKLVAAGNAALGLWLRAGSYAAQHLTDGIVPGVVVKMCKGSPAQVRRLVEVGLWHEHGHTCPHAKCQQPAPGDYYMHDYLAPYNPSRVEVERKRERAAAKKRDHRARQSQGGGPTPPKRPRPQPEPEPGRRRPAAGPIPDGWQPDEQDVEAAQLARADAGLPQLTPEQLDTVTRRFVRRMADDQVCAAAWGGRWQQWAERERTESAVRTSGNVVHLPGAVSKAQQQIAGLSALRQQMNGGQGA